MKIYGLESFLELSKSGQRILLVDDVFDTGRTIEALVQSLEAKSSQKFADLKIAVPWYKPKRNTTNRNPDYYLHTTDDWLVFPHEIKGLSNKELRENKAEIDAIIRS